MAFKGWFDGELRPDAWFDAELHPAGWFDTELIDTVAAGGATDHPATIAAVLDGLSASASASLGHPSSVSATLDGLTVSVSATVRHPVTLSATLDGITTSVSATAGRSATLAGSLDSVTVAVSSTLRHPSSITAQLDGITPSFSAKAGRSASASATLGDVSASISGATGRKVTLGATLADVGFSANASVTSGSGDHPASIAFVLDDLTAYGSAVLGHTALASASLDSVSASVAVSVVGDSPAGDVATCWGMSWGDSWANAWGPLHEIADEVIPEKSRYSPTCEVITPSRRGRRTKQRPAVVCADVIISCRIGCQAKVGLSLNGAIDCGSTSEVSAAARLHFGVTATAEITPKLTATGDCYDTLLEMLLAA